MNWYRWMDQGNLIAAIFWLVSQNNNLRLQRFSRMTQTGQALMFDSKSESQSERCYTCMHAALTWPDGLGPRSACMQCTHGPAGRPPADRQCITNPHH
ncbi:hypothetical protein BRADI_1g12693v3 [Brachypodium distachyon]|uniref:Uncharacterized protein n=1 Tax=Brachypodium distachyon TaxID=15368 RepID=A0A2K2DJ76_BRADI|nr:hypothetical protein BRADI_1g12693v3 [Brachypodium distachyon]